MVIYVNDEPPKWGSRWVKLGDIDQDNDRTSVMFYPLIRR